MMFLRRLVGLRFFGSRNESRPSKLPINEILHSYMKDYNPSVKTEKINLEQLNIQHQKDTDQISKIVPELQHGLDQYLNGELVFGDNGVGILPQQSETTPNEIIQQMSGYVQPSKDATLLNKTIESNCRYLSSTSSISTPLIVLYYLFGCFRHP